MDKKMPSILDREITNRSADSFGHQDYADALESLIESESNKPPFSIGLLGGWGTGKSTIKSLYIDGLNDDIGRRKQVKALTFNAWRYGGNSDIKRALLRHVYLELDGNEEDIDQKFYCQIQKNSTTQKSFCELFKECIGRCIPLFYLIVILALIMFTVLGICRFLELKGWLSTIPIVVVPGFVGWLIKNIFNLKIEPISLFKTNVIVQSPATTSEQYEQLLIKHLHVFKQKNKSYQRLVVFIDDLDRLSEEEMVAGLDAIRTFMEIPADKLPGNFGIVFVVSCFGNGKISNLNWNILSR